MEWRVRLVVLHISMPRLDSEGTLNERRLWQARPMRRLSLPEIAEYGASSVHVTRNEVGILIYQKLGISLEKK
jgi:hypothetical protein